MGIADAIRPLFGGGGRRRVRTVVLDGEPVTNALSAPLLSPDDARAAYAAIRGGGTQGLSMGSPPALGGEIVDDVAEGLSLGAGGNDAAIAVAPTAEAPERFAAEELQRYVEQVTASRLPIVEGYCSRPGFILGWGSLREEEAAVAEGELAGRGEDGYLMHSFGSRIALVGNSPRATLYAVYHFLEKYLGCGWCVPGEDVVPRRPTIRLGAMADAVGPPDFTLRQLILYPYGPQWMHVNTLRHVDWLAKNRLNWAHAAPNGPGVWEASRSRELLVPEVRRRGLHLQVGGHTFSLWLPPDRYAESHPEFYALLDDNSRRADGTHETSLCVSNPQVIETVAANINAWLEANPEVDAVDLWHNDSYTYCHCPNCLPPGAVDEASARLAYTATYVRFVNEVARRVGARHPRVLVNLLAYAMTTACPPAGERCDDNVLVGLCLFPRPPQRTLKPIETSDLPTDAWLRPQIPAWRRVCRRYYIYEYYTWAAEYHKWTAVSMIAEDLRYFLRIGVDGVSSDQWGPYWYPLNMYAFARLAWQVDLEPDALLQDFCDRYYGPAAQPMTAYWRALEEGLRESWHTDRPPDWRDEARLGLIREALESTGDDGDARRRVLATAELHDLPFG